MNEETSWSRLFEYRSSVHKRYSRLWDLRSVRKRVPFILKYLREGESVLEVGAFNRDLADRIKKHCPQVRYKSMDIDPTYPHDYASFEEIKETFDLVLLFEVIEHLTPDDGREMVAKIHGVLRQGGRVIVTTPNVYTPGQYWKDITHLTPYHYEELGGAFLRQGFELVEINRLHSEPFLRFFLKAYFFLPLFRFLGVDFTKSILLVARKA